jgi:predicted ABC-type ATPase
MTPETQKRLRMFAGPNGSGKTSLVRKLARDFSADGLFQLHHFINADDLFRDLQEGRGISLDFLGQTVAVEQVRAALVSGGRLRPHHPFLEAMQLVNGCLLAPANVSDNYVAAAIADFLREELLVASQSFSFETVMSHRSKIDFFARARAAGYRTYLYFIATESSHLNIYRVQNRAALGGHDVPEDKIVERYKRCLELVGEALSHAYWAFLFDNSGAESVWLAQLTPDGVLQLKMAADSLPAWFRTWIAPHYAEFTP